MNMRFARTGMIAALLLAVILSVTGGTIAWFTDSVETTANIIQSGNLDVELSYQTHGQTGWTEVTENTNVFKENALWEPGYTEVIKFKVANAGTLALKYQLTTNVIDEKSSTNVMNETFNLSDHIKSGILVSDTDQDYTRETALAAVKDTAAALKADYLSGTTSLKPGEVKYVTMVVFMPAEVGNEANYLTGAAMPEIKLGIKLDATQLASESDSFGNTYDSEADFPGGANVLTSGNVTVKIPDNAPAGHYALNVVHTDDNTADDGKGALTVSLTRNGQPIAAEDGVNYSVKVELEPVLDVKRNGTSVPDTEYDPLDEEGVLSFETASFSTFDIEYRVMGENVKIENRRLTAGIFNKGYDPAELDPSLKEDGSEYLAVSYEVADDTWNFYISKRDSTVIWTLDDPSKYTPKYANYNTLVSKINEGTLWDKIRSLQNNEHNTVYLLPGVYEEGTTINVYSSMDIIGLGPKDSVKVIKAANTSSSNRHLFNCNGTKPDYIEVTLRNLYLDATNKTVNSTDNAAVQSIRKTKVKCYDLTIVKGTDWDAVAFYVNGNNAVDGVKYPAYLYAENCTLNTNRTFGIVTTSGSYKFYHNNLKYNNGDSTYTCNSGNIKNQTMAWDDWDWEN